MRLSSEVLCFTDPSNNWSKKKKDTLSIRSAGLHDLLHSCINIISYYTKDQIESVTCEAQEERRKNGITTGNSPQLSQIRYNTKEYLQNKCVINAVSDSGLSCGTYNHSQQFGLFLTTSQTLPPHWHFHVVGYVLVPAPPCIFTYTSVPLFND